MRNLISENNELIIIIVKSDRRMRELKISPVNAFKLLYVRDVLSLEWHELLRTFVHKEDEHFHLHEDINAKWTNRLCLQVTWDRINTTLTAQQKFIACFAK